MRTWPAAILLTMVLTLAAAAPASAAGSKLTHKPPVTLQPSTALHPSTTTTTTTTSSRPAPTQLPRTGTDLRSLLWVAVGMLLAGGALRLRIQTRRRRHR